MKPRSLIAVLSLVLGFVHFSTAADAPAEPPEILTTAMKLAGRWQADARLSMGGETYAFVYTLDFRSTAGGAGMTMDEHAAVTGIGELLGTSVIGFDPYEGRLHWFSVDNFGTAHNHVGELVGPGHLRLVHESHRDGKPFREQIDFRWLAADRVDGRLIATLGGEVAFTLEGEFLRVVR